MNKEQLLKKLEHLLKPILKDCDEVNYGLKHSRNAKTLKEGIEFIYQGYYCRIEIK